MNDELEMFWIEVVVAYVNDYPGAFLDGLSEVAETRMMVCVCAQMRTGCHPYTSQSDVCSYKY